MNVATNLALTPEAWWQAADERRILLLRCPVCSAAWLPWAPHCPDCGPGTHPETIEACGRGTLYSWVGVQRSVSSPEDSPFTVAAVRLVEGAMMYGRLRLDPGEDPQAEGVVEAVFVERGGRTVVDFVPRSGE
jgi:uncharacterized OB-fold protein